MKQQAYLVLISMLLFSYSAGNARGTYTSNKKTNAVGKSDEKACNWAFLSAMKSLQERAIKEGGDAVINIYSFYNKNKFVSATEFECGAGATIAGVTMVRDVVKLAE